MCRSIKTFRQRDRIATDDEIKAAALQFVRKVSGFGAPSQRHAAAFGAAVDEISTSSRRLLASIAETLRA